MLDPEEYVVQNIVPCRESDMCWYTNGTYPVINDYMNRLWRADCKVNTSEYYPVGKMHGDIVTAYNNKNTLHVFCKRKDLPVVEKPTDIDEPIFGNLPTCPINKNGGWYVTANGLVVHLDTKSNPSYQHPECHRPLKKVNHGLDLMETTWWHPSGDVYFKSETERKLCQPLLRIVAKLENFDENPPNGFVFKDGFPKFEKVEERPGIYFCQKYTVSGDARVVLSPALQTSLPSPDVAVTPTDLLFGDKPTISLSGEGVYITADGSVAIINKEGRDTNTVFRITETRAVSNVLWMSTGPPAILDCQHRLRLVAKICDSPIKEVADKTGRGCLIGAKMRPFKSSDGFTHYIPLGLQSGTIMPDEYDNFLRPVTLAPANLNFFGQNRIFVNPVLTPVLKEVAMSPTPATNAQTGNVTMNPVIHIAKTTGNFAARSANYWLAQPTMIMGGAVVRSLRFIFASAVIGSIVGSISYPDTAKKFAASLVPKVELKIEKPSILK